MLALRGSPDGDARRRSRATQRAATLAAAITVLFTALACFVPSIRAPPLPLTNVLPNAVSGREGTVSIAAGPSIGGRAPERAGIVTPGGTAGFGANIARGVVVGGSVQVGTHGQPQSALVRGSVGFTR